MSVTAEEFDRRVHSLEARMRDVGLRLTHQRLEVMREVASTETHPDVETIYRGVRTRMPTISLDTVYRTLSVLAEHGVIDRVTATAGPARYDGNPFHHHHFTCRRCGLVKDIDASGDLTAIQPPRLVESLGEIESAQIQYRGLCTTCRKSMKSGEGGPAEEKESDHDR